MRLGIRTKILVLFTITLAGTSLLNLFFTSRFLKEDYRSALYNELRVLGNNLQTQLQRITSLGIAVADIEGFDDICTELAAKEDHVQDAMIVDMHGTVIFHSNPDYRDRQLVTPQVVAALAEKGGLLSTVIEDRNNLYYAVVPITSESGHSRFSVIITSPANVIDSRISALIRRSNIVLVLTFGLVAAFLLFQLRRILTAPLAQILHAINIIVDSKNLHQRVDIHRHDEIGQIAVAFNHMLDELCVSMTSIENLNQEVLVRERAERQAHIAQKEAEQANMAKSTFLANMSHEIRTPMNSIIGFGELLCEESLEETEKEYAQMIINNGRILLALINDILDFSKIEADKMDVEIMTCRLETILANLNAFVYPLAMKKDIEFKIIRDGHLPDCIETDQNRLQQCLLNLVNNALKFTDSGHVYVTISLSQDAHISDGPVICFDVEDTGIGIRREQIEHIFDSFSQADSSTTRKYGGTGLGLAISRKLVALLGGQISVYSELGKGSTFSLRLPVHKAQSTEEREQTAPVKQMQK